MMDEKPLSSLPTANPVLASNMADVAAYIPEIAGEASELQPGDLEWLARLEHAFGGRWTHRRARIRRLVGALRQAASTLSRLREERDEALGWRSDRQLALDNLLARALKAEDLNRKLVEGLRELEHAVIDARQILQKTFEEWSAEGQWSAWDATTINNLAVAQMKAVALLSSISGGEGKQ